MSDNISIPAVPADNAVFQTERDGRPEVLVVNKALHNFAYPDLFRWHLSVAIPAKAVDDNGMPAGEELELVNESSDKVTEFVLENRTQRGAPNALFLSHSTWNGLREVTFRVHDPEAALALMAKKTFDTWARDWEFQLVEDPEWKLAAPLTNLFAAARAAKG